MLKPASLHPGDTIGIVSLASPPFRPSAVEEGKRNLEKMGFKVVLTPGIGDVNRYLAGSDQARLDAFHQLIADPTVKAIMSTRGGYGSSRLLPKLDFDLLKKNPKIIIGYSDITSILTAVTRKLGLATFYGPMLTSDLTDSVSSYSTDFLMNLLCHRKCPLDITAYPDQSKAIVYHGGKAEGELIGGCLTLLTYTMGTPYEIDTRGRILFIEEIDEAPYKLDGMLTHLINAGKFQECAGVVFGELVDCNPRNSGYPMGSFHYEEVIQERLGNLGIPVIGNLCFGHGSHKATLPLGIRASLDTAEAKLSIIESAVE
ncbi:MAG: LD-carboxypeptidase [Candidatus Delongbacteria bacterium]|nr:LD-carboxypeptidase [Candidatus Delongbacteria bacterium]